MLHREIVSYRPAIIFCPRFRTCISGEGHDLAFVHRFGDQDGTRILRLHGRNGKQEQASEESDGSEKDLTSGGTYDLGGGFQLSPSVAFARAD